MKYNQTINHCARYHKKLFLLIRDYLGCTSPLVDELLSTQNPDEWDNTLPNYPEGGWKAADGYSTNCLDTSLSLSILDRAGRIAWD